MNQKRVINILFVLTLLILSISSCTPKEVRRILVVHSYEKTYIGYPSFNRMIADEFKKRGIQADLRFIYLDCESYQEHNELQRMSTSLDSVAGWKPEVILVNEDQATYSLLKCGNPMVKQLPIVFAGVNYPNWNLIEQYPNVTGFHDKIKFKENIEMGKRLFGKNTSFFSLIDSTYIDLQIYKDAYKQLENENIYCFGRIPKQFEKEAENGTCTYYSATPVRRSTAGNALIWTLSKFTQNRCYLQIKRDFTTINVGNVCSSPSLTAINEAYSFGERLAGGYFTPLSTQVEEEVKVAIQLLHGATPSDIGIKESAKQHLVDWNVMEYLQIPLSTIPSEYTIQNIPFHTKHPLLWFSIIFTVSSLIITIIIWLTFLYRREYNRKKKVLYALADEKEALALAITGSNTFAWKLNGESFVFEKAFWQLLNLPSRQLTLKEILEFFHPNHKKPFIKTWGKLYSAQKEIIQVQCDFNNKGYQWWEFRYTTTCMPNGEYRTAGLLLNIQNFKDREMELEEAKQLAEKAELKESFLANMSHEIRTPLNAIVGFSTMLTSDEELSKEEKDEFIQVINHNNELLLKLINDILELSRLKSGNMSFVYEEYFVDELIDNIYATHQVLIPPHLSFLKEEADVKLQILADKGRITQVITNLLNNACKFTQKGSIKLGYRHVAANNEVEIYVEDTGKGINPEEQKIIFTRFYKQDEFAQGVGLGLSICQSIVEKLNGRIELKSEPGKGSRFTLILPCKVIF